MIENLMASLDKVKINDSIKPNILEGYKKEASPLNYEPLYEGKIDESNIALDEFLEKLNTPEEESDIYKGAGLEPKEMNERECLVQNDINYDAKDSLGRTNLERMEQGLSPLDKDGKRVELHHIGQEMDSPLAELSQEQHRGKGNDGILHDKTKESEINRNEFNKEKEAHWKARAEQVKEGERK